MNTNVQVKMCDFGISGNLTNSVAKTVNAGCKPYMAPERIDGDHRDRYDVRSDVWSLAITLLEVATGQHPYAKWKTPFEQLRQVFAHVPLSLPLICTRRSSPSRRRSCPPTPTTRPSSATSWPVRCRRTSPRGPSTTPSSRTPSSPTSAPRFALNNNNISNIYINVFQVPPEELGNFVGETLDLYEEEKRKILGES